MALSLSLYLPITKQVGEDLVFAPGAGVPIPEEHN